MAEITVNPDTMQEVGENIRANRVGDLLVIVVDTTVEIDKSTSGKMMGNASTGGFSSLPGGLKGNIYIGLKI